jgi:uncharacterized protein (TIGR03435 family)
MQSFAPTAGLAFSAIATLVAPAILGIMRALPVRGQASSAQFEVASIKPTEDHVPASMSLGYARNGVRRARNGRLTLYYATLQALVVTAYKVNQFQIAGGPSWLSSDEYEVIAKTEASATPDRIRQMLQSLLAERFKLKLHRETRELPIYELTVAKGGPKLVPTKTGRCIAYDGDGPRPPFGSSICGGFWRRLYEVVGPAVTIPDFIGFVEDENLVDRAILDKTGITGRFDIDVKFDPCTTAKPLIGDAPAAPNSATCAEFSSYPSLGIGIREQLGLRLDSAKGPVEVLVIDRAERPSAN